MLARDVSTHGSRGSLPVRVRFVESSRSAGGGAGVPVVLLHDGLASHETFLATMEQLSSSTNFRVVAPDLPGFGASEKPDPHRYPYGYDGFADSIADFISALGLGRAHVRAAGNRVLRRLVARAIAPWRRFRQIST